MLQHLKTMAVRAGHSVPSLIQEVQSPFPGRFSIVTRHRRQVQLEQAAHIVQAFIIRCLHIAVSLGMGDKRLISSLFNGLYRVPEVIRRREGRGLHQHQLVPVRKKVAGGQTGFEERIQHILGGQVQAKSAFVHRTEFIEAGTEPFRGIGDILHDMGGEPHFPDALFHFQPGKDGQRLLKGFHTVVQPIENMAVIVGGTLEKTVVNNGFPAMEKSHIKLPTPLLSPRCHSRSHNRSHSRNHNRSRNHSPACRRRYPRRSG